MLDHDASESSAARPRLTGCVRDAAERAAAAAGLLLRWLAAGYAEVAGPFGNGIELNVAAQVEAAIRTTLVHASALPLRLVFMLNQSGASRPTQRLIDCHPGPLIGSCILGPSIANSLAIGGDDALALWIDDLTCPAPFENPYASRAKALLYRRYPLVLDALRQRRTDRLNATLLAQISPGPGPAHPPPGGPRHGHPGNILFCLYWLDFGGAEAFALQAMAAARRDGFRVIVTCDEPGRHRLLAAAHAVADAVYLIGSFGHGRSKDDAWLRIVAEHRPDIIHIHHSFVAYRMLRALPLLGLATRVLDTTHILEHRDGDFPKLSIRQSPFIDRHHVVSQTLAELYTGAAVPPERVRLGRLHDMSAGVAPDPAKWASLQPIRIAFVGRFTQQKRPYVFIEIARRLVRRFGPQRFRFQAVGEGRLRAAVEFLARRHGLADVIDFLPGDASVPGLLASAHVLVICSDNEGLTLVGFEAIRADCLVISSDVGGQRELIPPEFLVPRYPFACVRRCVALITRLADNRLDPAPALRRQRAQLERVQADATGLEVCLEFYRGDRRPMVDVAAS